jgi:integrase
MSAPELKSPKPPKPQKPEERQNPHNSDNPEESKKPRRARAQAPHPYRRKKKYWARIPAQTGGWKQRSLKTSNLNVALSRCAMLRSLADEGRFDLLERLVDGRLDLVGVHDAYRKQQLTAYLAEVDAAARNVDLEPHVARWLEELQRLGLRSADDYHAKVRTLMPAGRPFRRSMLTLAALQAWQKDRRGPTRNRYRTALSVFLRYCMAHGLLEENVALKLPQAPENDPRVRYLERDEVEQLLPMLPEDHRLLHVLLISTGVDVAAALGLCYRGITRGDDGMWQIEVRGSKTRKRSGGRRLLFPWAERALERFLAAHPGKPNELVFASLLPDALTKPGLKRAKDAVRRKLKAVLAELGITDYSTRDHRHTFAVQARKAGYRIEVVAQQLGHRDTKLAQEVYGLYVPDTRDYARSTSVTLPGAVPSGTAPQEDGW